MEYVEYALPELEDVQTLKPHQQSILIEELNVLQDYQRQVVEVLLEQKIVAALELYQPNIQTVIVHPTCIKENEGYQFKNAMVWVDDWVDPSLGNNSKAKFQAYLDDSLKDLAPLMRDVIDFNVPQLVAKYKVNKTEKTPDIHFGRDAAPSAPTTGVPDFSQKDRKYSF